MVKFMTYGEQNLISDVHNMCCKGIINESTQQAGFVQKGQFSLNLGRIHCVVRKYCAGSATAHRFILYSTRIPQGGEW
jgi:hypothetical protein